jgi:sulfite reductase alpha subunit-like flavoprotein
MLELRIFETSEHQIVKTVERFGEKSNAEAVEYVAAMEREGRLIEECWS